MTEASTWWSTTGTGDGPSGGYTRDQHFAFWRRLFVGDNYASQGPLKGYLGELAVTAGTGKVTVAPGGAIVYGIPYANDANVDVTIPTPTSATRIDRIVLRASWSAQTVRITRIAGTEGGGAPSITQTPGTTYDVKLAQVSVTPGGVITVTDERQYCRFATEVATENLADAAVTYDKLGLGSVTNRGNVKQRVEGGFSAVAQGGSTINFSAAFGSAPAVVAVAQDTSQCKVAVISSRTTTGFTVRVYNTSGSDVGGNIYWLAIGQD